MKRFQERTLTAVCLLLYSLWTGISGRGGLRLGEALCEFSAVRLTLGNRRSGRAVLPFCMLVKVAKVCDVFLRCEMSLAFEEEQLSEIGIMSILRKRLAGQKLWCGGGPLGLADASCKARALCR